MTHRPSPPALSRWLLQRALPSDVRADVAGDLTEVFQRDVSAVGLAGARRRYRAKARSFMGHFLRERLRDSLTGLRSVRLSALDFRLGVRMLIRYPGLTIVGGLALAFAIAVGVSAFMFVSTYLWPTLPLDEGDRIVAVRQMDAEAGQPDPRITYDFTRWRTQLTSVVELGAMRERRQNLVTGGVEGDPIRVTEVTTDAFRLARVAPLLGRGLQEEDDRVGAPAVFVIGYSLWQTRFSAAPNVVGTTVMLDGVPATVVGVMPAGFLYPVGAEAWTPLQVGTSAVAPRQGPAIHVIGRLAPGVTIDRAQSELTTIGVQIAEEQPATHRLLRPEVIPFAASVVRVGPMERLALLSINAFVVLLLVLVSGNVALLMFARTASREHEIAIRGALGASRGRMVAQFFAEALVLGGVAAALGLVIAREGLRWGYAIFEVAAGDGEPLPFWFTPTISNTAMAYAVGLTVLAAIIAGVMPALKVTRGLQSRLKSGTPGGGGLRFGGVWTFVIVTQVALTVTFPATAFFTKRDGVQIESVDIGVPPERVLTARVDASLARAQQLVQRLEQEPGVVGVTLGSTLPMMYHPLNAIEVEDIPLGSSRATGDPRVSSAFVLPGFFATFDAPVTAGRGFTESDQHSAHRVVIVNETLVASRFGGMNPVGRRIRVVADDDHATPSPWAEVIGVVRDLGMGVPPSPGVAGLYYPLATADSSALYVAVRVAGDATTMAPTLRAAASAVASDLRVWEVQPLSEVTAAELRAIDFFFRMTLGISAIALVLSLASIYAVMSFAVSRRTREIGIRIALGSERARVVLAILRRPLTQVSTGLCVGLLFTTWMVNEIYNRSLTSSQWLMILGYGVAMLMVCLLACLVPARRALAVEPTEALRAD